MKKVIEGVTMVVFVVSVWFSITRYDRNIAISEIASAVMIVSMGVLVFINRKEIFRK